MNDRRKSSAYGELLVTDDPAALARQAADHLVAWAMEGYREHQNGGKWLKTSYNRKFVRLPK
jgi:hypothetical protein